MPLRARANASSPVIMTLVDGTDIQLLELFSRRTYGVAIIEHDRWSDRRTQGVGVAIDVWARVATADGTIGWLYFQYRRLNEVLP